MSAFTACKRCGFEECTKNGKVRNNQQRYKCPRCALNFVEGDKRVNASRDLRNALASFFENDPAIADAAITQYLDLSIPLSKRQRKKEDKELYTTLQYEPTKKTLGLAYSDVIAYLEKIKPLLDGKKRWLVAYGELLPGYEAVVILRPTRTAKDKDKTEPSDDHDKV